MYLVVGLGNPGSEYANTRHNIGFKVVDEIVRHFNFLGEWQSKFQGLNIAGKIPTITDKIICIKPMTFMNLSGVSIAQYANFYKIPPENIFVFHDEINLPVTKIRVKQGGGHGGHNGLKSIDAHLGKDYWRIRIGVEHPGNKDRVKGYVLNNFKKTELAQIEEIIENCAEFLPLLLKDQPDSYMNKISLNLQRD